MWSNLHFLTLQINFNWHLNLGNFLQYLLKHNICLICNLAILFSGRYPIEMYVHQKLKCARMLIIVLLVIAQIWKGPKCPSRKEQIMKLWYIYLIEHYTTWQKNLELHKDEFISQKCEQKKSDMVLFYLYLFHLCKSLVTGKINQCN